MNSTFCGIFVYDTQREAIREATADVKKWAEEDETNCTAEVALWSGDMLIIKATPKGEISKSKSGGWNIGGFIYMSRKVAKVYGVR